MPQYRETLPNGVTHNVIEIEGDTGIRDNTQVYVVPPGYFFMMGDNRDNSTDSRDPDVGYVPFENFVGRAEIIFFSIDENSALWRQRHVQMVERQIGTKSGTGGSTGAPYLRSRLDLRFYGLLWELRALL